MADIRTGREQWTISRIAPDRKEAGSQSPSCYACCRTHWQATKPVRHDQLLAHHVSATGSECRIPKAARELVCTLASSSSEIERPLPTNPCLGLRGRRRAGGGSLGSPYPARTGPGVQTITSPMDRVDCWRTGTTRHRKAPPDLQCDRPETICVEGHGPAFRAEMEDSSGAARSDYWKTKRLQPESWPNRSRSYWLSSSTPFLDRLDR